MKSFDKLAFSKNNANKPVSSRNINNKPVSRRNNGNYEIDRFDIDGIEHVKKSKKLKS